MSVVVKDNLGKTKLITKGAVEEMLSICRYVEDNGKIVQLNDDIKKYILKRVDHLNSEGMRVIAIAQKNNPKSVDELTVSDEMGMTLMGYLAFLDPPKESCPAAIHALEKHGVSVKILTGDNEKVTRAVCRQVGISVDKILLGSEVDRLSDAQLSVVADNISVFAKLSPSTGQLMFHLFAAFAEFERNLILERSAAGRAAARARGKIRREA